MKNPSAHHARPHRLMNRNFVLLWQGQLVSQLGNQAFFIAMMYWTMQATGSASLMGLLMTVSALPGVFLTPVGGTFADRHSRRTIIVMSDIVRGLGVLGLAVLMHWSPGETDVILGGLFTIALFSGIVGALFQPAISAAIPDLVPRQKLPTANSLNKLSVQGSVFVGQAVGGVLFRLLGAPVLFLIDGVSFLLSAFSESFIQIPQVLPEKTQGMRQALATYKRDTVAGLHHVWRHQGMRDYLLAASALNFFLMPVTVMLPFYVENFLGPTPGWFGLQLEGPEWYGFLLAATGAGAVGGYLFAGAVHLTPQSRATVIVAALFGAATAVAVVGNVVNPLVALMLFFAIGLFTGLINIFTLTLFQASTPGEMRGRVMALAHAISAAAAPIGMGLGGLLGDLTNKNIPLLYGLAGGAMALITLLVSLRGSFRNFLALDITETESLRASAAISE